MALGGGCDRCQVIQDDLKCTWVVRKLHAPIKSAQRMADEDTVESKFNAQTLPPPGNLLRRHSRRPLNPSALQLAMFRSQTYSQLHQLSFPLFLLEVAGFLGDLLTSGTSPPRNPVYRLFTQFGTVNTVRFVLLITCLSVYCLPFCLFTLFCLFKKGDVTMLWCHRPFGLAQ